MKGLIKKQFKSLGVTQATFCEKHGFDNSNFSKTYNRLGRNFKELKEFLDKLDLDITIAERQKRVGEN